MKGNKIMDRQNHIQNLKVPFLLLGLSIMLSALIFGYFFYQSRMSRDYVEVVGAATERFESDIVKWNITIEENTGLENIGEGYRKIQDKRDRLMKILNGREVPEEGININPINTQNRWEDGKIVGYTLRQSLFIISEVIEKIENLALNPDELLENNIFFQSSSLEYFYSKIDLLKKDLLTMATKNARERAEKILQDSPYHPGRMISAKAGVFQIIEPYSTEVESYGMHNTSSRKKDITVTVHA
ncbi:MAG: SIMPL domain-containing protein [Atribacterota bacterium]|nr:SIMPL domain-containing protein [Atribacterota bacterium]